MAIEVAVKERPILMSGPMVYATLAYHKTQTRRVIKPQPKYRLIEGLGYVTVGMNPADDGAIWYDANCIDPGREVRCPYGRIGDRLWVRENWYDYGCSYHKAEHWTEADDPSDWYWHSALGADWHGMIRYAADDPLDLVDSRRPGYYHRKRPSIHMPRWASRLSLEITDVRVERIQEISIEDVLAEGVKRVTDGPHANEYWREETGAKFVELWDSINAKRGYGWSDNPWVWAISFRRVDT